MATQSAELSSTAWTSLGVGPMAVQAVMQSGAAGTVGIATGTEEPAELTPFFSIRPLQPPFIINTTDTVYARALTGSSVVVYDAGIT